MPGAPRNTLPRSRRLQHDLEYQAVFDAKMRKSSGLLTVFAMPNGRGFPRLGLSIGKRVGMATMRSKGKRLIREAFRLSQHDVPTLPTGSYDIVVAGKQGLDDSSLELVRASLLDAMAQAHDAWTRRLRRSGAAT